MKDDRRLSGRMHPARGLGSLPSLALRAIAAAALVASSHAAGAADTSLDDDWKALAGEWRPMYDSDGPKVRLKFYEEESEKDGNTVLKKRVEYTGTEKFTDPERHLSGERTRTSSAYAGLKELPQGRYVSYREKDQNRLIGYVLNPDYLALNGKFLGYGDQKVDLTGRWVKLPAPPGATNVTKRPPRLVPGPRRPTPRRPGPSLLQLPD
jgi:hypothetical protein